MVRKEPKYRKRLSEKQLKLIKLIYKFRFVSADLVGEVTSKSKSSVHASLSILVAQGYIARRFEKRFKLIHRPAIYYLDLKSIRLLRDEDHPAITEKTLRNMYKNKQMSMSMNYVNNCFRLISVYAALKRHYPDTFEIFTKYELSGFDEFPRPLPDLYLRRHKPVEGQVNEFMLTVLENNIPYFVHVKQMRRYQTHEEDGDWEGDYPHVLLVAPTDTIERRIRRTIENTSQDFEFYTTTVKKLTESDSNPTVWAEAFEEDDRLSLNDLKR